MTVKKVNRVIHKSQILFLLPFLYSCTFTKKLEERAWNINRYEYVALKLAKENRMLRLSINRLNYDLEKSRSRNNYLELELKKKNKKKSKRSIASVGSGGYLEDDAVGFDLYKWRPDQMLAIAQVEFKNKNYEKSAQYFKSFSQNFPHDKHINDEFLFQAGMAAFESKKYHHWALDSFTRLIREHPASQYYLGAKLWMALTHLQLGNRHAFYKIVDEFHAKYRNTAEWEILSGHYQKIVKNYAN